MKTLAQVYLILQVMVIALQAAAPRSSYYTSNNHAISDRHSKGDRQHDISNNHQYRPTPPRRPASHPKEEKHWEEVESHYGSVDNEVPRSYPREKSPHHYVVVRKHQPRTLRDVESQENSGKPKNVASSDREKYHHEEDWLQETHEEEKLTQETSEPTKKPQSISKKSGKQMTRSPNSKATVIVVKTRSVKSSSPDNRGSRQASTAGENGQKRRESQGTSSTAEGVDEDCVTDEEVPLLKEDATDHQVVHPLMSTPNENEDNSHKAHESQSSSSGESQEQSQEDNWPYNLEEPTGNHQQPHRGEEESSTSSDPSTKQNTVFIESGKGSGEDAFTLLLRAMGFNEAEDQKKDKAAPRRGSSENHHPVREERRSGNGIEEQLLEVF